MKGLPYSFHYHHYHFYHHYHYYHYYHYFTGHLLAESRGDSLTPTLITCVAEIRVCEKCEQWLQVLRFLAEMRGISVVPNDAGYNAAISACGKGVQGQ